jgi:NADPH:quinone reductase-like Zn-dependent oxidoreductase
LIVQENIPIRRVIVTAFGGPEQLTFDSVSGAPTPGALELLVDVEAAGINYLDGVSAQRPI